MPRVTLTTSHTFAEWTGIAEYSRTATADETAADVLASLLAAAAHDGLDPARGDVARLSIAYA